MTAQFANLENAIIAGQVEIAVQESIILVESGKKPIEVFSECIEPVLAGIRDQFSRFEIFLPEMITAAAVVKAVQEALNPSMAADQGRGAKGKVVIPPCVDVSPQSTLSSAREFDADIIALSALMLPSLPFVKDVIDFIQADEKAPKWFKVIVGGDPVSKAWPAGDDPSISSRSGVLPYSTWRMPCQKTLKN